MIDADINQQDKDFHEDENYMMTMMMMITRHK